MKPTLKKLLLQLCGYGVSIAPIAVILGLKWDTYTATTVSSISLGVGGAMCLILFLIKSLGKMPNNVKPIIKYGVALALVLALQPILDDLKILITAAIVGEILDMSIFEWQITKVKREIEQGATLDAMDVQTKAIVDALKENNQGRV